MNWSGWYPGIGAWNAIRSGWHFVSNVFEVQAPTERWILMFLLFNLSVAYGCKSIVFGILARWMFIQESFTPVGRAMLRHFAALCTQSTCLCLLYFYYGQNQVEWGRQYGPEIRYPLYVFTAVSAWAVVVSGAMLLRAHFNERKIEVFSAYQDN